MVSFSFDVGNGPVELTVRSSTPLNDDQWHRVEAERNIKEAVLRLDKVHREARLAPPQGHTHLQLFSQLFVGKTFGRCLGSRSLAREEKNMYLIYLNVKHLIMFVLLKLFRCLGGAERISGLHSFPKGQWSDAWPWREGKGHTRGESWMLGSLQQLWDALPEWREMHRKIQRILMRLQSDRLRRAFLQWWYGHLSYIIST